MLPNAFIDRADKRRGGIISAPFKYKMAQTSRYTYKNKSDNTEFKKIFHTITKILYA